MKRKIIARISVVAIILIFTGVAFLRLRGGIIVKPAEQTELSDNIISFRQDDEAWAGDLLENSSYHMDSSGCLVTCIASAVSSGGEYVTPGELNALFSENNVYDNEGNLLWSPLAGLDGYHVTVYQEVSDTDIEQCISEGHYPIVRVRIYGLGNFHYVLIAGSDNGEYICMDPLRDELTKLSDYMGLVYAVRCVWKE